MDSESSPIYPYIDIGRLTETIDFLKETINNNGKFSRWMLRK